MMIPSLDLYQIAAISFVIILGLASVLVYRIYRVFSCLTHELECLLDNLDVEGEIKENYPRIKSNFPQLSRVVESCERLFERLRSYKEINIKRILIEKRRADIIAASISEGILLLRDNEILYANPAAKKIMGLLPQEDLLGIKLGDPLPNGNSAGLQAIEKAIRRTFPVEFSLDEEYKRSHYLIRSHSISGDLVDEFEDFYDRKKIQNLGRFQANTLIIAQDVTLVRESQEAKCHFLATLSHEIRTPVTSLTMATRLLKRVVAEIPNPTHQSLIQTCAEDVDRLRVLMEDLLTVSRFDTLTQRLEFQSIDLGKLLVHSVQSFQSLAIERGISLSHRIINSGNRILLPVDPTKIAWALSNLMTNALRHTPRDGKVEAIAESFEDRVEMRIIDSGPGIEGHRQERIFEKFNPYYDLRVARSGSIGVGLAIAREIVEAHGGQIWVKSHPGQGAEFCFSLPFTAKKAHMQLSNQLSNPISAKGVVGGAHISGG